ncbi:phage N-6-adenine-methyltransferase [Thiohalospira halophila DSM 15071]|uniref:Phage N-6-adenine-methyltransferase n=1 Tax=Thiohalospira halophila DSM 15071 TaxID=1123397 RepID=A0A1I1UEE5_9GAMM|nr:DNA N-6-adenine-methyltransferase [Thiohalospira halophila]SFD67133.1 phage N-6-adenine-methyltransferase [Thiohalospira halophila DSM 15071]
MDAYARSRTPKEERDRRGTPWPVYHAICTELGVEPTLDVCAEPETAKAPNYWTAEDDALARPWPKNEVCWMNPPYSDPGAWCRKAAHEASHGSIVIGLLPDDRSTEWYQNAVHPNASAIYITTRRIAFLDANGQPQEGNPKGSIVPIWTPWRVEAPAGGVIAIPDKRTQKEAAC